MYGDSGTSLRRVDELVDLAVRDPTGPLGEKARK
jgi:hypothetical protein